MTVLSNSRDNGAEFCRKAAQACEVAKASYVSVDESPNLAYDNMRMELRITRKVKSGKRWVKHEGRIKVLAANPRTARGFSGDLILDEFAFHENSYAIWEAAEPILTANREFLCRIASTGNGRHNLFYRMAHGAGPDNGQFFDSAGGYTVRPSHPDGGAQAMGVEVYMTRRRAIRSRKTEGGAGAKALDKRAYDQNYECKFEDEKCVSADT